MNDFTAYASGVSAKLNIAERQVQTVLQLLGEGATIPFLARYRKDQTGNLDEVQIEAIQDEAKRQQEFAERKAFIREAFPDEARVEVDDFQGLLVDYGKRRGVKVMLRGLRGLCGPGGRSGTRPTQPTIV
jgi:transcriptional accessory protein Tex/SPT6